MAKKILTLDIGAATVSLAEYEAGPKGALTLVNYGTAPLEAPLDSGDAATILAPALLSIVREKGIKPGPVAISVPGQMVFPRFAAIPEAGGADKFEQMVRYEVEQNIPFPIDEMVCDRQPLGETEAGDRNVLIVAAKTEQIEAITSAVTAAGFQPEIVDAAPIALTNAIRAAHGDEGCFVALDIGARTTSLVICEGDRIYNRSVPVAGNAITKEIAQALGCGIPEAESYKLANAYVSLGGVTEDADEAADRVSKVCRAAFTRINAEISRSINFYRSQQGGGAPTKLYLTGGSALLPQADAFFSDSLGIEVELFNPFAAIAIGAALDATALETDAAFLGVNAGLAMHAAGVAKFAINLVPSSIVAAKAEKAKIPFVVAGAVALVAAAVLLWMAAGDGQASVDERAEAAQAQANRIGQQETQVKKAAEAAAAKYEEAERFRELLASRPVTAKRLKAVTDSLMPGMWIDRWEGGRITVRGWKDRLKNIKSGKTPGEVVVDRLKRSGAVNPEKVRIADMAAVGKGDQIEQFTVEVTFK